ncbi:DNA polymerase III subunit delta [Candidatus Saccharibacteria bacterium]|nr:DNA polymerase III subunit delta [Candidatus Saccharibacteria bacterium]
MIYFYYGENDFAQKAAADKLIAEFAHEVSLDAVAKFDTGETDSQQLIAEIVGINLFAPRRLMVIKNTDQNREFWHILDENMTRISESPNDVLLLAATPDKRTKTYKNLLKKAETREFALLRHYEIVKWIAAESMQLNLKIQPDAAEELATTCSDDQWRIWHELEKLAALNRLVDKKCIQEFIEPDISANAFEILNLVLTGDLDRAQDELQKLRETGEDANKFLGLLSSQVFALAGAIYGGSGSDVAKDLKIHPFQLGKMRDLARDLDRPKERVKELAQVLAETDARMKLSNADEAWALVGVMLGKIGK